MHARSAAIWDFMWADQPDGSISGHAPGPREGAEFWTDALAKVKSDPKKRFEVAQRHLPLPAAWTEMAISLRAMIREARTNKT